jgi:hypothetical protein
MTGQIASNEAPNKLNQANQLDRVRMRYGFLLILITLALSSGLFVFVGRGVVWDEPSDIPTGLGALTTLFGTLVGLYFGHQAGSSGKEQAEASRERSDAVAKAALIHIDPATRQQVMETATQFLDGDTVARSPTTSTSPDSPS